MTIFDPWSNRNPWTDQSWNLQKLSCQRGYQGCQSSSKSADESRLPMWVKFQLAKLFFFLVSRINPSSTPGYRPLHVIHQSTWLNPRKCLLGNSPTVQHDSLQGKLTPKPRFKGGIRLCSSNVCDYKSAKAQRVKQYVKMCILANQTRCKKHILKNNHLWGCNCQTVIQKDKNSQIEQQHDQNCVTFKRKEIDVNYQRTTYTKSRPRNQMTMLLLPCSPMQRPKSRVRHYALGEKRQLLLNGSR
jgi:hypothetical protein